MRGFGCLAFLILLVADGWARPAAGEPFTLNSGTKVEILSVRAVVREGRVLTMTYRGKAALADRPALRREVDGLWEFFVINAERGDHRRAAIVAVGPAEGTSPEARPVRFAFEKRSGTWRALESATRVSAGLDKAFVQSFQRRIDWAARHGNTQSLLAMMDRDWTTTIADPWWRTAAPVTLGREMALEAGTRIVSTADNHSIEREILAVEIAANRRRARIDSRETDTMTLDGRSVTTVTRASDHFALRGDVMLWVRSVSHIERLVIDLLSGRPDQTTERFQGRTPVRELRAVR
ncbi:MAG: hypothetical protein R3229_14750 [Alphaproteobacteria bacterium]|nr:hypothetical protein [Alphaproteobacteria bacterium]